MALSVLSVWLENFGCDFGDASQSCRNNLPINLGLILVSIKNKEGYASKIFL
jgi:hypothetical protein